MKFYRGKNSIFKNPLLFLLIKPMIKLFNTLHHCQTAHFDFDMQQNFLSQLGEIGFLMRVELDYLFGVTILCSYFYDCRSLLLYH